MSTINSNDDQLFLDDTPPEDMGKAFHHDLQPGWQILVVDDEEQVHSVTHLVLDNFYFDGKKIKIIDAYSGEEAIEILEKNNDVGLILLDVVMESETAGLEAAKKIREDLKNKNVRIVLRTGQPGQAPEQEVIVHYDINDYKDKTELTAQKLNTLAYSNLRSFRDILQVEQSRQELEESKKHILNIINSMPSVLVVITPDFSVTDWNLEATKLTGVSGEQASGHNLFELYPPFGAVQDLLQHVATEKQNQTWPDVSLQITSEQIRHFSITVYPLKIGVLSGHVLRFDDITAKIELEKMMMQSEKMMTIGGLAAGMAHEIKNPLGAIVQSSQNVLNRLDKNLAKNQETATACQIDMEKMHDYLEQRSILKYLDSIRSAVDRALNIIAKMLRFGRNDQSERVPSSLPELMDEALSFVANDYELKKTYDFKKTSIVKKFDPQLPEIPCARTELVQVFLNLLKNAGQAMPETQKNPQITVHIQEKPDFLRIIIEDNGSGMDEKIRANLFKPFFTTKKVGIGTGLGLSVCQFIITELHHGVISVESEAGKGTQFIIDLPKTTEISLTNAAHA